jgi:uncharacterized hydantoinase/oxoprolinase family protein
MTGVVCDSNSTVNLVAMKQSPASGDGKSSNECIQRIDKFRKSDLEITESERKILSECNTKLSRLIAPVSNRLTHMSRDTKKNN